MKAKHLVCLAVLLVLTELTVYAQGYTGPGLESITVAEAKNLRDSSPVVLRGKIERSLGDEKYLFSDDSGTITVEIDDRLWVGLSVNQNDTVEISGEVDKDFRSIEIEVSAIKKL
ncbi:MAG: NirD/YgiW/YdeI family stress tolerance protein [Spirochaetaceae bacterium]|jgi:uncharacterized protein (TIGR00156 family)|nr:NirD/YgiW/YdeI family stress tolerance protein [Spirochaetaceae bacterium]